MAKKAPIVWHLDTDSIEDFRYNPDDRLTRIKKLMIAFQADDSTIKLKDVLKDIQKICEEKTKS